MRDSAGCHIGPGSGSWGEEKAANWLAVVLSTRLLRIRLLSKYTQTSGMPVCAAATAPQKFWNASVWKFSASSLLTGS